jgi:AcrR family transcriptional regulator
VGPAAIKTRKRRRTPEPRVRLENDERRRQLLDLGVDRFGGRSYDDVSIDDIAQAAGISKGLLYHYFPTKRAFYAACVAEAAERVLAACTQFDDGATPLERLDRGIAAYLAYVQEHGRAYANLMRSGVGVDREIAAIVDETRAKFVGELLEGLGEAIPLTPLMKIALRGWVGLAEAATLAWVESGVEDGAAVPAAQIKSLLKSALLAIVARPR